MLQLFVCVKLFRFWHYIANVLNMCHYKCLGYMAINKIRLLHNSLLRAWSNYVNSNKLNRKMKVWVLVTPMAPEVILGSLNFWGMWGRGECPKLRFSLYIHAHCKTAITKLMWRSAYIVCYQSIGILLIKSKNLPKSPDPNVLMERHVTWKLDLRPGAGPAPTSIFSIR